MGLIGGPISDGPVSASPVLGVNKDADVTSLTRCYYYAETKAIACHVHHTSPRVGMCCHEIGNLGTVDGVH